jgi:hypothetical protein
LMRIDVPICALRFRRNAMPLRLREQQSLRHSRMNGDTPVCLAVGGLHRSATSRRRLRWIQPKRNLPPFRLRCYG